MVVILAAVWHLIRRSGNPWDFHTFYHAAMAALRGLDPYRLESLTVVAGKEVTLPFLYPGVTLALFVPFTMVPIQVASWIWLGIKLAMTGILIWIWRPWLQGVVSPAWLVAVAAFGFNGALLLDLTTGNVSALEQLLLWLAFGCYWKDRRLAFALLVAAASVFKLLPIAFLLMLLAPSRTRGSSPALAALGLGVFAALLALPALLGLHWAWGFLANLSAARTSGEGSPSMLGMLDMIFMEAWPEAPQMVPIVLWALFDVAVIAASWRALARAWKSKDPREWILLGALLFAVTSPRMMLYSYVLLVVPALMISSRIARGPWSAMMIALLTWQGMARCLAPRTYLPAVASLPFVLRLVVVNLPFLLTLGLWFIYVRTQAATRHGLAQPR